MRQTLDEPSCGSDLAVRRIALVGVSASVSELNPNRVAEG